VVYRYSRRVIFGLIDKKGGKAGSVHPRDGGYED